MFKLLFKLTAEITEEAQRKQRFYYYYFLRYLCANLCVLCGYKII